MRAYVGITDGEWFEYLRSLDQLDEVNFWKPGGKHRFGALHPGEAPGYLTVNNALQVEVSRRLHQDFDNGRDYYALQGTRLRAPQRQSALPERAFLEWHQQNVFRG